MSGERETPIEETGEWLAGDLSFEEFFRAEFPGVMALARVLCGERELAAELAQEAMLRAFRNWEQISTYDSPGAWVRRVAANLAISTARRRRTERSAIALLALRSVEALSEDAASDDEIWALVRKLPRQQREAVALFYLEDWSVRQISEFLECSEATARVHLHKARARLARGLGVTS